MLSTILELAGFASIIAAVTLAGVVVAGLFGALIGGLLALGAVLLLLGLAFGDPQPRRRVKRPK